MEASYYSTAVHESKRLSVLKREIPEIGEKILIQELKNLVESNLAGRINYGEVLSRVEYKLTSEELMALPLIGHLKDFADNYTADL